MSGEPNLRVLKPSRKKLRPGDVFTLSPRDGLFLFGRLLSTEAVAGTALQGLNLIYVYDIQSRTPDPPDEHELTAVHLLAPPMMINRLPWSRGYFETVAHRALTPAAVLPVHCFRDARGRYFDENGNQLDHAIETVGVRAAQSFRTVDDVVSGALGLPLA